MALFGNPLALLIGVGKRMPWLLVKGVRGVNEGRAALIYSPHPSPVRRAWGGERNQARGYRGGDRPQERGVDGEGGRRGRGGGRRGRGKVVGERGDGDGVAGRTAPEGNGMQTGVEGGGMGSSTGGEVGGGRIARANSLPRAPTSLYY
eukprot:Gb_19838 [translate_table: standard]